MNNLIEARVILISAWRLFKSKAIHLMSLFIAYCMVLMFLTGIDVCLPNHLFLKNVVFSLLFLLIYSIFSIIYITAVQQTINRQPISFPFLPEIKKALTRHLIATILYMAIVLIGFAFFIIPGIYLLIRLQFYPYAILQKQAGSIDSILYSWNLTKGASYELLILTAYSFMVSCIGVILFIFGLFVAIPYILTIQCYTHKILSKG